MKAFLHSMICAISAILLFNAGLFAQKELVISGGNSVSSIVCANNIVLVWGDHYGSTPVPIVIPGVSIKQVSSGSGSHFVALDCEGKVWAWGNNSKGQCGNGIVPNAEGVWVSTPAQVKASYAIDAANRDDNGNLINVAVVYAGNNCSFAILCNGDLVSWGGNDRSFNSQGYDDCFGQLGDGTEISRGSAVYVIKGDRTRLTKVKEIYAGDNMAMALTCDGEVYTWGNGLNGTLARNAAGTANPNNDAMVRDSYARPAYYGGAEGPIGRMNNIEAIQCGDVFNMALDWDGYVWTWGNGGWNNCTGTGYAGSTPHKVKRGEVTGEDTDGTYLLAKKIGAGRGFGMAVTKDKKPVAWGGGGCGDGGVTGNNSLAGSGGGAGNPSHAGNAVYVRYGVSAGAVHNDVILINRGDTWGFYRRSDGSMWGWGCNSYGQLGLGNTTDQAYAVQINIPTSCLMKDPEPEVNLTPKGEITVDKSKFIEAGGIVFNAGFTIDNTLANRYSVTWYRNDIVVKKTDNASAEAQQYTVTDDAYYEVEIEYTGNNSGCNGCGGCGTPDLGPKPKVRSSLSLGGIKISFFPQLFEDPGNLTYCNNEAKVNVNQRSGQASIADKIYNWYPTPTSTTVLGTTTGTGSTTIDVSSIAGTTTKTVYVEEIAAAQGIVLQRSSSTCTNRGTELNLNNGTIIINL